MMSIVHSPTARPLERDWKPLKVMLPITKLGVSGARASEGGIMYAANSLTGTSVQEIWENKLQGLPPPL